MILKPHFLFTRYKNSFSVKVKNLEKLTVAQIQAIEEFVRERKGVFDFNAYSFVIQKRLEFNAFAALLKSVNLNAFCEENIPEEKFYKRVGFGQYKGMRYDELPDSYLQWLKSNYRGYEKEDIAEELKKRNL
mgnify:CR=1 FL=1